MSSRFPRGWEAALVSLMILALLTLSLGISRSEELLETAPSQLTELKEKLDLEISKLSTPIETLRDQYRQQLERLMEKYTEKGSLKDMLLVRKELGDLGKAELDNPEPDLLNTKTIYLKELRRRELERDGLVRGLLPGYVKALTEIKTSLTRGGKLDEALVCDREISRVEGLLKLSAQSEKAAVEPEQIDPALVFAELRKHWHPAIWTPGWVDEKWRVMELKAAEGGAAVSSTSDAYKWARVVMDDELKLRSDFELIVRVSGDKCHFGVIHVTAADGGCDITSDASTEPVELKLRCLDGQITFFRNGTAVRNGSYEFDLKRTEQFRAALQLDEGAAILIHGVELRRGKRAMK